MPSMKLTSDFSVHHKASLFSPPKQKSQHYMSTPNVHCGNKVFFCQFGCIEVSQKIGLVKGADTKNICKPPRRARDGCYPYPWVTTAAAI